MIIIEPECYKRILKHIITFLSQHHQEKFCIPMTKTIKYANQLGLDPQELKSLSIKTLSSSRAIKYMNHTHLHWAGHHVQNFLVYVFLTIDTPAVMYAKYAINRYNQQVFFMAWHPSNDPGDHRFQWLIRR